MAAISGRQGKLQQSVGASVCEYNFVVKDQSISGYYNLLFVFSIIPLIHGKQQAKNACSRVNPAIHWDGSNKGIIAITETKLSQIPASPIKSAFFSFKNSIVNLKKWKSFVG